MGVPEDSAALATSTSLGIHRCAGIEESGVQQLVSGSQQDQRQASSLDSSFDTAMTTGFTPPEADTSGSLTVAETPCKQAKTDVVQACCVLPQGPVFDEVPQMAHEVPQMVHEVTPQLGAVTHSGFSPPTPCMANSPDDDGSSVPQVFSPVCAATFVHHASKETPQLLSPGKESSKASKSSAVELLELQSQ